MLSLNKSYKNRKVSLTIHCKYKYFDSTVQRAEDRRQKFYFCRLLFAVNVKLNLSNDYTTDTQKQGWAAKSHPRNVVPAYIFDTVYIGYTSISANFHLSHKSLQVSFSANIFITQKLSNFPHHHL